MNDDQIRVFEKAAINLALRAGDIMQSACGQNITIETKMNYTDLVTETDKQVEKMLFDELEKQFPNHKFIGEETTSGKIQLTDDPTWIIDPIDGTLNFVHTFPYCCVSIGLLVNKEMTLGIIYSPFLNKMYTARKGKGAYCNGKPISTRPCSSIKSSLIISEYGSQRFGPNREGYLKNSETFISECSGIRALGSAALNLAAVAEGFADAYFEFGIHCWDVAAGALIVREAGGTVVDTTGGPFNLMSRRILATGCTNIAQECSKRLVAHLEFEED